MSVYALVEPRTRVYYKLVIFEVLAIDERNGELDWSTLSISSTGKCDNRKAFSDENLFL